MRRGACPMAVLLAVAAALAGCGGSGSGSKAASLPARAGTTAGTGSSAASTPAGAPTGPRPLPKGEEGTISDIPWAAVGVGWLLVEFSPADAVAPGSPSAPGPVTLYLVDPDGGRYDITTVQSTGDAAPGNLVAWSGDGRRAMFTAPIIIADRPAMRTKVTELDLTDASSHSFTVTGIVQDAGYTRPTGQSIVVSVGNGFPTTLERFNRSGTIEVTYPAAFATAGSSTGGFLYTADGTEVVMGTTAGLEVVSNSGQPVTALPVPTGGSYCIPKSRWGSGSVLAACGASLPRLWVVPLSDAHPTALTAPLTGQGQDQGDLNAWQLPGGVFVQSAGACGYQYLARLGANGSTTPVAVPGVAAGDSVSVIGSVGSRLAIRATIACGPGRGLAWYDPAAKALTPLLGPPLSAGSVSTALLFPT